MKLIYKIIGVLALAFLLPVALLGAAAFVSMRDIGGRAGEEARQHLVDSERARLLELTQAKSLEIAGLLALYEADVQHLQSVFDQNHTLVGQASPAHREPELYPEQDRAGLPGYGYVHPKWGAYADFDHRGAACPWASRPVVARTRTDADYRQRVANQLREVMLLDPYLARVEQAHRPTLDLVWVMVLDGVHAVRPPYDYPTLLAQDPGLVDVDEAQEEYVRLLGPKLNPSRATRWLEPYLDRFKGIWMTSCVAPLYEGDEFLGTVGLDILLPAITDQVLALKPAQHGYAFLAASNGQLIAVPEQGLPDIVWDETHRAAIEETFLPPTQQHWTPERVEALQSTTLAQAPDPALVKLAKAMERGERGTLDVELAGQRKLVCFAPLGNTGWMLGVVVPMAEVVAPARALEAVIIAGTTRSIRHYLILAALLIVVSVGLGFLLHYQTIRPLVRLSREMRRVSWDRLETFELEAGRRDEIGLLFDRFRDMLAALRSTRDEVTAQRAALAREKELLAVTLGSIGDGVIATDVDGRVALLNGAAAVLTGVSAEEARGRPFDQVVHLVSELDRSALPSPVEPLLHSGAVPPDRPLHAVLVTGDGDERVVATSVAPILGSDDRVVGVVLVLRDISETRRMQQELIRTQKLESVRLLAAGIAHDFNNLLTAILGNVSLARMQATKMVDPSPRLTDAEVAILRARELTTQLLTFSSGGAPVRRILELAPLLESTLDLALAGSAARWELDLEPGLWRVQADGGQIGQVVHNLALNAEQAMPRGGRVQVRARNRVVGIDDPRDLAAGRYVEVEVEDQGVGITAETRQHIFEAFFTTKPQGSGLGLAVCHSIVKQHGGYLEAQSEPGQGTLMRFLLPATDQAPIPDLAPERPVGTGTGRVLVLDDEPLIRAMADQMLQGLGYSVQTAADGTQAVQRYREALAAGQRFDVVILDLTIKGGVGGQEVLRELRQLDPEVRAIVSSGYFHDPVLASHTAHGYQSVLTKPYSMDDLEDAVERALSVEIPPNRGDAKEPK